MFELIVVEVDDIKKSLLEIKINILLSEQYDKENVIIEIRPGAGGTESCDWANMQIGRAAWRVRLVQYVLVMVVGVRLE